MSTADGTSIKPSLKEGGFLGHYRISSFLGKDAFGESYEATSSRHHRTLCLRLLPAELRADALRLEAFRMRSVELASMENPYFVRLGECEEDMGLAFVTEDMPEPRDDALRSLADIRAARKERRLAEKEVVSLARQLGTALAYAHGFRGRGVVDGQLRADQILMTPQGRIRIRTFGLGAAIAGDTPTPDADIRALGTLFYTLLTGLDELDISRKPSDFGVQTKWNRIVEKCLRAGTEGGYTSVEGVSQDLELLGEHKRSGKLKWIAAAIVAIAVLAGLWLTVGPKGSLGRQAEKTGTQAQVDRTAEIAVLMSSARASQAAGQLADAEKDLKKVLAIDPVHVEATQLLSDIRMERGLKEVGPIKSKAEQAWQQVLEVEKKDGFDERIAKTQEVLKNAQRAFSEMHFEEAGAQYRSALSEMEKLLAGDKLRLKATRDRIECERARDDAETADCPKQAADSWASSMELFRQAEAAFTAGEFASASTLYGKARSAFSDAILDAGGRRRAEELKAQYTSELEEAEADLLARIPPDVMDKIKQLAAFAEKSAARKDWAQTADRWKATHAALIAALDKAVAAAGKDGGAAQAGYTFPPRPAQGNLVANGTMEQGSGKQAKGWSKLDGLTAFWQRRGKPGSCIVFDTSVLQVDKAKFNADPAAFEGRKEGNQYATVGAHEGVWAFSTPIPVYPDDKYFILEADVMGPAKSTPLFYPQVLIRGYQAFDPKKDEGTLSWFQTPHEGDPAYSEQFGAAQRRARKGDFLMVFRHGLVCRNSGPNIWEHYRMGFKLPDDKRFRPEVLLLKAYAMWPLGEYRFDNISLKTASEAEYLEAKENKHSIKGFMETAE